MQRLEEEIQDLHQDRLVLFDVRSDKSHVMRQPQQLSKILLPLRTAWEGEKQSRAALKSLVQDNCKWSQLYEVSAFFFDFSVILLISVCRWRSLR